MYFFEDYFWNLSEAENNIACAIHKHSSKKAPSESTPFVSKQWSILVDLDSRMVIGKHVPLIEYRLNPN